MSSLETDDLRGVFSCENTPKGLMGPTTVHFLCMNN